MSKVPVILVVGKREAAEHTVAVRRLGGKAQEVLKLEEAIANLVEEGKSPLERTAAAADSEAA